LGIVVKYLMLTYVMCELCSRFVLPKTWWVSEWLKKWLIDRISHLKGDFVYTYRRFWAEKKQSTRIFQLNLHSTDWRPPPFHNTSSWVKRRIHTRIQLPMLSGSALKVYVVGQNDWNAQNAINTLNFFIVTVLPI
jgi:hypothetical protein